MDFVIYLGIAVNIIGAILLMIYAVRYSAPSRKRSECLNA